MIKVANTNRLECELESLLLLTGMSFLRACLSCLWARHLTESLHFHVADRWWSQAVYQSWWPSQTEDSQTEPERIRSVYISSCIILSTNSLNDKDLFSSSLLRLRLQVAVGAEAEKLFL